MTLYAMFVEEGVMPLSKGQVNSFIFTRFNLEDQTSEVQEEIKKYLEDNTIEVKILKSIKFNFVYFEYDKPQDILIIDEATSADYWIGTDDIYTSFDKAWSDFSKRLLPGAKVLVKDLFKGWD